ncbi:hypothetical protein [Ralstonia phage phiRSL1]|uniref:Uncharacterized protein n=1 Tax=Ralstonia phage phiRSL1 TaxID=1980924 RepID=B2ZXM6_9CAUD|nr:hypothetical protein RSL1_ORF007 [Ralstonia phage phiRSL1]BAG41452.1 hypothetical protein [Ralstonia phage phiRSL1]
MLVNQLIVLPTQDTLAYLNRVFDGCSFDIDWSQSFVEVNSSVQPMEADPTRKYTAVAGTMNVYYDSATGDNSLLLPLVSDELVERCAELRVDAPSAFYGNAYFPFLVVKRNYAPRRAHRRYFITSIADVLYADRYPLTFDAELVLPRTFETVPDMDYYVTRQVG